jgi:hypothetical protein
MKIRYVVAIVVAIPVVVFVLQVGVGTYRGVQHELDARAEYAARFGDAAKWREGNRTTKAGILCQKHPDWQPEVCENVATGGVTLGMNAEQVRLSWGKPSSINETQVSGVASEQWLYSKSGTSLYLQKGVLTSWQTPK